MSTPSDPTPTSRPGTRRGKRGDAGQIGSGVGFGQQLAPALPTAHDRRQVGGPLLGGTECKEHRGQHLYSDGKHLCGRTDAGLLLGDHVVLPGWAAVAAALLGPRTSGESRLEEALLPAARHCECTVLALTELLHRPSGNDVDGREVLRPALGWRVLCEPSPDLDTERPRSSDHVIGAGSTFVPGTGSGDGNAQDVEPRCSRATRRVSSADNVESDSVTKSMGWRTPSAWGQSGTHGR